MTRKGQAQEINECISLIYILSLTTNEAVYNQKIHIILIDNTL